MATVLIVEDEIGIGGLLEDVLLDEGHRVLLASNGRQALELVARDRPELILTDYMMPVMDGAAFMKALADEPSFADIPVLVMSSMPEKVVAERCPGYAKFIRKPFSIFEVIDVVQRLTRTSDGESQPIQ